jgi:hypothetical protein
MILSPRDHFSDVYKRRDSYSFSPTMSVLSSVIPAQAVIHRGGISAFPTGLLDYV